MQVQYLKPKLKMNLRLELPICRICSENDSKWWNWLRGFLAYFILTRWMEGISETLVELWGQVGIVLDLEDGLEEAWGRPEVLSPSPLSNLLLDCDDFFCTECSWGWLDSTGRPPWKPGGSYPQSTPPAHFGSFHLRVETIDSSQKFWLWVKTLTRNFDSEKTSQSFD